MCDAPALRRHIRDYHGKFVRPGKRGFPVRENGARLSRKEYQHQRYLERRAAMDADSGSQPVTAEALVAAAWAIDQSAILTEGYKADVLKMGFLPLLEEHESLPHRLEMVRQVGGRITGPVLTRPCPLVSQADIDEVPRVARFLRRCRAYRIKKAAQKKKLPWLPSAFDAEKLVPLAFTSEDWPDAVEVGLRHFLHHRVLSRIIATTEIPTNVMAEFLPFAMFDREWARECWGQVRAGFLRSASAEVPTLSRSQASYIGIWLLVPWILARIASNWYGVVPGSTDFFEMVSGFERGEVDRVPFKFDAENSVVDLMRAGKVHPGPLPSDLWSWFRCNREFCPWCA
ncbi:hypothetical protein V1525DRAFT_396571 [Lipomyces kononenkoae]|uniref:Uncharacterized protein n=1 Tax=Lipomyces kononenkoae TaxID=34357 RepID=A0ACC3T7Q8_LIPKO